MPENISATSPTPKKRGRPPKKPVGEVNQIQDTKETTNEFCSYNSATQLSTYYFGLNIFDYYTPEQLSGLIKDPMGNNDILRKVSLMLYSSNGAYTNTVDYMTAMPTLDKVIVMIFLFIIS